MGKRIPFDEYYPVTDEYRRFDSRNTTFSLKRQRKGAEIFTYTQVVANKMKKGMPGFSTVDVAFKNAAETYTGRARRGHGSEA